MTAYTTARILPGMRWRLGRGELLVLALVWGCADAPAAGGRPSGAGAAIASDATGGSNGGQSGTGQPDPSAAGRSTSSGAGGSSASGSAAQPSIGGASGAGGVVGSAGNVGASAGAGGGASAGTAGAATESDASVPHRPSDDYPPLNCADVMRSGPVGVAGCGGLGDWQIPTLSYAGLHDDYMDFVTPRTPSAQPGGMTVTRHLNNSTSWTALRNADGFMAVFAFLDALATLPLWQYTLLCQFDDKGALTGQIGDLSALVGKGTARQFTMYDAAARGGTVAALLEQEEVDAPLVQGMTLVANGKRLLDFGEYSTADPSAVPGNSTKFSNYYPMHMALTADGRIVLAGEQRDQRVANGVPLRFLLLDAGGTILTDVTGPIGSGPNALAIGKDDEVIALYYDGVSGTGMQPNGHLDRYDLGFKRIATSTPPGVIGPATIDINAASQFVLAGMNGSGKGWAQVMRTSDFGAVGPAILSPTNATPFWAADLTDGGELLLSGISDTYVWLMRYDSRGTQEWSAPKTAPATNTDPYLPWWIMVPSFVSLETNGNVLISNGAPLEYCP